MTFDGASVPKFLATFLSPVCFIVRWFNTRLWIYKNLLKPTLQKSSLLVLNQKQADKIFRDINIEVNGFYFLNYLALLITKTWWVIELWNGHRKRNAKYR